MCAGRDGRARGLSEGTGRQRWRQSTDTHGGPMGRCLERVCCAHKQSAVHWLVCMFVRTAPTLRRCERRPSKAGCEPRSRQIATLRSACGSSETKCVALCRFDRAVIHADSTIALPQPIPRRTCEQINLAVNGFLCEQHQLCDFWDDAVAAFRVGPASNHTARAPVSSARDPSS